MYLPGRARRRAFGHCEVTQKTPYGGRFFRRVSGCAFSGVVRPLPVRGGAVWPAEMAAASPRCRSVVRDGKEKQGALLCVPLAFA